MKYTPKKVFILEEGKYIEMPYEEFNRRKQEDESYREKWFLSLHGMLMEVTKEEYLSYYKEKRRQRYIEERAKKFGTFSYDALTTDEFNGEDILVDSVTDISKEVEHHLMLEKLLKVAFQYKNFLGYKKGEDGKPVIDIEQADVVKFIYDRYLAGDSLKEITKKLMDLKISTPLGKQHWSCSTVRSILTNEKYKGDAIINKTFVVDCISKRVKVNNGERKKYYVENNHPAIVDAATFAKVQEEIARRSGKKKIKQVGTKTELGKYCGKYALTERLLCGECKTPYRRCTWTVKGKKKIVWRCINRLDYGKKYCHNSPTIEENVLHEAIMAAIQQTAQQNMDTLQALKTHIGVALGAAEKEENTVEIEFRIAQIDAEFKSMIDTASADTVDGLDESRIQQLIAEKNELQAKLGEIDEERGRQQTVQDRLETIYTVLDGLKNRPMTYDDEVVRQLIDCVVVESKDRIKVIFRGGLQVEQQLRQEDLDFLSEMGQIPVNI